MGTSGEAQGKGDDVEKIHATGCVRTCRSPLTTRGEPKRSKRVWLGSV